MAVSVVQWQGDDGGLMFTSASRWRRSRRTARNVGGQVAPDRGQGGDFRKRKYYPVLDGRQARAAGGGYTVSFSAPRGG